MTAQTAASRAQRGWIVYNAAKLRRVFKVHAAAMGHKQQRSRARRHIARIHGEAKATACARHYRCVTSGNFNQGTAFIEALQPDLGAFDRTLYDCATNCRQGPTIRLGCGTTPTTAAGR